MKCCDLTAGMLRHLVELHSQSRVPDGAGGGELVWTPYDTQVRAYLKPISATERFYSQRLEHAVTHRLWLRYRTGIKASHRVVYAGRAMQIRGILNLEEANRWLELTLEEGAVL